MFKHELGTKVKDRITGLVGTVVGRTEWLYGCRRYVVQPEGLKDGKPIETIHYDEDAVEPLDKGIPGTVNNTGGPQPEPKRQSGVSRF
jgi:hypothetical protein